MFVGIRIAKDFACEEILTMSRQWQLDTQADGIVLLLQRTKKTLKMKICKLNLYSIDYYKLNIKISSLD